MYIVNKNNKGAKFSRNIGFFASTGEYVAFLDDDDYWMCDKIDKQMELFDDSVGMVYCNGIKIYDDEKAEGEKLLYRDKNSFNSNVTFEDLLKCDQIGTTTQVVIKKEVFAVAGVFDCDLPAIQDYEMWIRISKYFKIKGKNEPLFVHRIHRGKQISKNYKKAFIGYNIILDKYRKYYNKSPRLRAINYYLLAIASRKISKYGYCVLYLLGVLLLNPKYLIKNL